MASKTFVIRGYYHKPKGAKKATKCFPDMNDLLNSAISSKYAYNELKQKFQRIAVTAIRRDLRGWKPKGRVRLHFKHYEPVDGHYRDFDNVSAGAHKIIIDSLGSARNQKWTSNTIVDDSPKYLLPSVDEFHYTKDVPYIEVTIEEVNE